MLLFEVLDAVGDVVRHILQDKLGLSVPFNHAVPNEDPRGVVASDHVA